MRFVWNENNFGKCRGMANVVMFIALAGGFAFAITPAQDALRLIFWSWVRTTSTVGQKSKTGQNTVLDESAY